MAAQHFPHILVVHHAFAEPIVAVLQQRRTDLKFRARHPDSTTADDLAWADALVGFRRPPGGLGHARWVHCIGAGVDGWTRDLQWPDGVLLTRTTQSFAVPIGEYVLARVLAAAQAILPLGADQQARRWRKFIPTLADGSRAVVAGTGDLGQGIAQRLAAVGVTVDGISRSARPAPHFRRVERPGRLADLVAGAQWLVLAAPLTAETRGMVNKAVLDRCRDCWLINVARAPLVDEGEMLRALDDGRLAGAALDVFNIEPLPPGSPLWSHPRVVISPHVAGVTSIEGAVGGFLDALEALEAGRQPARVVDLAQEY